MPTPTGQSCPNNDCSLSLYTGKDPITHAVTNEIGSTELFSDLLNVGITFVGIAVLIICFIYAFRFLKKSILVPSSEISDSDSLVYSGIDIDDGSHDHETLVIDNVYPEDKEDETLVFDDVHPEVLDSENDEVLPETFEDADEALNEYLSNVSNDDYLDWVEEHGGDRDEVIDYYTERFHNINSDESDESDK